MQTVADKRSDFVLRASTLSLKELDDLINECLDNKQYKDATIYAEIYNRRVK